MCKTSCHRQRENQAQASSPMSCEWYLSAIGKVVTDRYQLCLSLNSLLGLNCHNTGNVGTHN